MLKKGRLPGVYDLLKVWNPSWFQGNRAGKNYFEGWYFKLISPCGRYSRAFIPGISLNAKDPHAFIQSIDGKSGQTYYFRFPLEDFIHDGNAFKVGISGNTFSNKHIDLHLTDKHLTVKGRLEFTEQTVYPAGLFRPGIMGWYRYMPFMECYHGVVSLDHKLTGALDINGEKIEFSGGRGYIEKDWGRSMPESWIWMQTNHFSKPHTSFMLSVANIPWIGRSFTGFLGFLLIDQRRYDFATYTGAKIVLLQEDNTEIKVHIKSRNFKLEVSGRKSRSGSLKAPLSGEMQRVIHESIDSEIKIRLLSPKGEILFEDTGQNAGLELVGNIEGLRP